MPGPNTRDRRGWYESTAPHDYLKYKHHNNTPDSGQICLLVPSQLQATDQSVYQSVCQPRPGTVCIPKKSQQLSISPFPFSLSLSRYGTILLPLSLSLLTVPLLSLPLSLVLAGYTTSGRCRSSSVAVLCLTQLHDSSSCWRPSGIPEYAHQHADRPEH